MSEHTFKIKIIVEMYLVKHINSYNNTLITLPTNYINISFSDFNSNNWIIFMCNIASLCAPNTILIQISWCH